MGTGIEMEMEMRMGMEMEMGMEMALAMALEMAMEMAMTIYLSVCLEPVLIILCGCIYEFIVLQLSCFNHLSTWWCHIQERKAFLTQVHLA